MAQRKPFDWPTDMAPQPGDPFWPPYGYQPPTLIYGSEKGERIDGTEGRDEIHGLGGDDEIHGWAGNDTIYADGGSDYVAGEAGNDVLHGGADDDWLSGEGDDDLLFGGAGNDVAVGGDGQDEVHGGEGRDLVDGADGDDLVFGDDGDDICSGFDGQDVIYGGAGNDLISGGLGNDVSYGGDGDDWMDDIDLPGDTRDSFYGGGGNDRIFVDNLLGALNDAVIDGGSGFDRLELCLVDETVSRIDALAFAGVTHGIEAIGLGAAGNSVLVVNPRDVLNFSDSDTLFVTGGHDALYYPHDNMVICDGAEGNWWTPSGSYAYAGIVFNSYQCVVDGQVATLHVDSLLAQSGLV